VIKPCCGFCGKEIQPESVKLCGIATDKMFCSYSCVEFYLRSKYTKRSYGRSYVNEN